MWWVTQYEFCWTFTAVCSSERILQIDQELTKLQPWLGWHPFFDSRCRSRNMADIQLIQCKYQQKTSSYRRNIVRYKEIGIKESNGEVRTLTKVHVHKWAFLRMRSENMAKKMLSDCQNLNPLSWSPRKMRVKDLRQRSGLAWFCACADNCVVFNTGSYTDLPDNSIFITANMQSETGFPSSHQLKS